MTKSTTRSLLTLIAVLSLPGASQATCIKYQGFLQCDGGASGFTDSSGNVWTQDRRGRQGVILNLDHEDTSEPQRKTVYPDGSFTIE